MPTTPAHGALYKLVGEIGTRTKSIEPSALEAHPDIFDCPQVRLRVNDGASATDKASAASEALTQAINTLTTKTDRLVAEAILGADAFRGLTIADRTTKLAHHKEGCSEDSYKKRRKRVLEAVVRYLLSEAQSPAPYKSNDRQPALVRDNSPTGLLASAADAGVNLLYACLVTQFANDFLRQGDSEERARYHRQQVWAGFGEYLFDAYSVFQASLWSVASPASTCRPALLSEVDRPFLEQLNHLLQGAHDLDPFVETKSAYDKEVFEQQKPGKDFAEYPSVHYRLLGIYAMLLTREHSKSRYTMINQMYEEVWMPWYRRQIDVLLRIWDPDLLQLAREKPPKPPHRIEEMGSIGVAVYNAICAQISFDHPSDALARQRAIRAIAYYFDTDEWLPVIEGRSLRYYVDRFFDQKRLHSQS